MQISISRVHFPVTTLGPGRRVGIWLQGCSIRCPGCVSADTWATGRGNTTVAEVVSAIDPWLSMADGVTISGGEPFDQPEALRTLIGAIPWRQHQTLLVYSGHPFENLASQPALQLGRIDALISDPYVLDDRQTLPLRGSDNQRLHLLTDQGKKAFAEFVEPRSSVDASKPSVDVMFDSDGTVWLTGIPRQGDMHRLKSLLAAQGHAVQTTVAPD